MMEWNRVSVSSRVCSSFLNLAGGSWLWMTLQIMGITMTMPRAEAKSPKTFELASSELDMMYHHGRTIQRQEK